MSASYALNATSASYAANATSASYANNTTSASYSLVATSASYANNTTSANKYFLFSMGKIICKLYRSYYLPSHAGIYNAKYYYLLPNYSF